MSMYVLLRGGLHVIAVGLGMLLCRGVVGLGKL